MKLNPDQQRLVEQFLERWPHLPYCQRFMKPLRWTNRNAALREEIAAVARLAVCEAVATYDPDRGKGAADIEAVTPRVLTIVKGHVLRYLESSSRVVGQPVGDLTPFLFHVDWQPLEEQVPIEAIEAVGRILAEQPRDVQEIVKLRHGFGTGRELSLHQVANMVGQNERTVRGKIARFHEAVRAAGVLI